MTLQNYTTPTFLAATVFASFVLAGCSTLARWTGMSHSSTPAPAAAAVAPVPVATNPVSPDAHPLDPALLERPASDFTLGPGDQVDIEVLGDAATREHTQVGPDGKIYFYILPGLDVWGMTLPQTRELIANEL